jgi:hypothetical protein
MPPLLNLSAVVFSSIQEAAILMTVSDDEGWEKTKEGLTAPVLVSISLLCSFLYLFVVSGHANRMEYRAFPLPTLNEIVTALFSPSKRQVRSYEPDFRPDGELEFRDSYKWEDQKPVCTETVAWEIVELFGNNLSQIDRILPKKGDESLESLESAKGSFFHHSVLSFSTCPFVARVDSILTQDSTRLFTYAKDLPQDMTDIKGPALSMFSFFFAAWRVSDSKLFFFSCCSQRSL